MIPLKTIAAEYSPTISHKGAVKKLSRWIRRCTPLLTALHQVGYYTGVRDLTPAQVALIYHHLGEP